MCRLFLWLKPEPPLDVVAGRKRSDEYSCDYQLISFRIGSQPTLQYTDHVLLHKVAIVTETVMKRHNITLVESFFYSFRN